MKDLFRAHPLLHQKIKQILKPGSTILELGSGRGTADLAEDYRVYTVEHDPDWLIYRNHVKIVQIFAPIVNGWYSTNKLKQHLPSKYDLILIDGPPGNIGRHGILKHMDLFDWNVDIIIDDTNRSPEMALAAQIGGYTNRKPQFFRLPDGRSYAWIAKLRESG